MNDIAQGDSATGSGIALPELTITRAPARWSDDAKPLQGRRALLRFGSYLQLASLLLGLVVLALSMLAVASLSGDLDIDEARLAVIGTVLVIGGSVLPYAAYGSLALCVLFYVLFVYRAMKNLHLAGARGVTISPSASVWWSFVPIANLVMIYQVMKEIWVSSRDPQTARHPAPMTLGWWWGLWIASGVVNRISGALTDIGMTDAGEILDANNFYGGTVAGIVSILLTVISIFLLLSIIRQVTDFQAKQAADAGLTPATS